MLVLLLALPLLAACEDDGMVMETDISEANINKECPVDVSEADRATSPARRGDACVTDRFLPIIEGEKADGSA